MRKTLWITHLIETSFRDSATCSRAIRRLPSSLLVLSQPISARIADAARNPEIRCRVTSHCDGRGPGTIRSGCTGAFGAGAAGGHARKIFDDGQSARR